MRSATSALFALALLTTTAMAAPSWEPEHKYDYHLPAREYRTAALRLSDDVQQHLPASLNNRLPYISEDYFRQAQQSLSSTSSTTTLVPDIKLNITTPHGFIGALLLVTTFLLVALTASRLIRAVRRRRFFARRGLDTSYSITKEDDDYVLTPFAEKPKLRLSPPEPSSPVDGRQEDTPVRAGGRSRDWMGGRESPV